MNRTQTLTPVKLPSRWIIFVPLYLPLFQYFQNDQGCYQFIILPLWEYFEKIQSECNVNKYSSTGRPPKLILVVRTIVNNSPCTSHELNPFCFSCFFVMFRFAFTKRDTFEVKFHRWEFIELGVKVLVFKRVHSFHYLPD